MENNSNQVTFDEAVKVLGKDAFLLDTSIKGLSDIQEQELADQTPDISTRFLLSRPALKLMTGKFGGAFYVRYLQDEASKIGRLQLVIEYPNRSCIGVYLCKDHFAFSDFTDSGLYVSPKKDPKSKVPMEWGSERAINPNLLNKFQAPNMPIPGDVLWSRIVKNYEKIPVVTINHRGSLEDVYLELAKCSVEIITNAENQWGKFLNSDSRYYIPDVVFNQVAEDYEYRPNDLKCELDMAGLLVKDKGSKGYQYSKRIKGVRLRFYVLRKMTTENTGSNDTTPELASCDNTDFETSVITEMEMAQKKLEENRKQALEVMIKYNIPDKEIPGFLI